jgi:hypothetical protein
LQPRGAASLQVVAVADRLRAIRLFEFVPVGRIVRVASTARQTRYERGHVLASAGQQPAAFLCAGGHRRAVKRRRGRRCDGACRPGFEDLLGIGRSVRHSPPRQRHVRHVQRGEFLTMMADNIAMAQGLFQLFLADVRPR